MKTVVLCPNPNRDKTFELTSRAYEILCGAGYRTVVSPLFEDEVDVTLPNGMIKCRFAETMEDASLLVSFGGDGSLLNLADKAAPYGVPILGVNMGKVGFMTELEPDGLDGILRAASGDYELDRRMMLDVKVERDGETVYEDTVLNDVTVSGIARLIRLTLSADGRKLTEISGDGVILATPTGSTAYSMSAGGPIVEPSAENIIVTPICPHTLLARSFVMSPDREVTVTVGHLGRRNACISADGKNPVTILTGDVISVRRSKYEIKLVRLLSGSFYEKVCKKLGEE